MACSCSRRGAEKKRLLFGSLQVNCLIKRIVNSARLRLRHHPLRGPHRKARPRRPRVHDRRGHSWWLSSSELLADLSSIVRHRHLRSCQLPSNDTAPLKIPNPLRCRLDLRSHENCPDLSGISVVPWKTNSIGPPKAANHLNQSL